MGWTANAPVIAQHEVKALREMVGSSYNGRLNLARSSSSMSNLPWSTARSCTHCPTRWPRSYRLARLAAKYGRRISASPARRARTMTWSLCEARPSAPDLTRKSVRRAVVRPLEALLDPLALVADGLDDDGHFCAHLGSSFLWGERIDGVNRPAPQETGA